MKSYEELLAVVKDCDWHPNTLTLSAACIEIFKKNIDYSILLKSKRWSCIDVSTNYGFSATCIDSKLGTIFGLDCGVERIAMVPQHRVKQETFVDFYLYVKEHFDSDAELTTFGEWAMRDKKEVKNGNSIDLEESKIPK